MQLSSKSRGIIVHIPVEMVTYIDLLIALWVYLSFCCSSSTHSLGWGLGLSLTTTFSEKCANIGTVFWATVDTSIIVKSDILCIIILGGTTPVTRILYILLTRNQEDHPGLYPRNGWWQLEAEVVLVLHQLTDAHCAKGYVILATIPVWEHHHICNLPKLHW